MDRVEHAQSLQAGADDYLARPFDAAELEARVDAVARRSPGHPALITVGDFTLDPATREVHRLGSIVSLTDREYRLVEHLVKNARLVVTRVELIEQVWDNSVKLNSNVIDVYVATVRAKLDKPFGRSSIETVRDQGYRLHPEL